MPKKKSFPLRLNEDMYDAYTANMEAFDKADMDIIREIYAVNARVEDPVGTPVHEGLDAVCAFYEGALASGAKLSLSGKPCCAGNSVAFSFEVIMPGATINIIDVFDFDHEGKISSMRAYWGPENLASSED